MASSMSVGSIVWVELLDPQGRNPKVRPAIVIDVNAEDSNVGTILVVAVSSSIGLADPAVTVALPWHRDGHPKTKFDKRSEAICNWVVRVPLSAVQGTRGYIPTKYVIEIRSKVDGLHMPPTTVDPLVIQPPESPID